MKVISISKKKFKQLGKITLSRNVTNTEARILDFRYKNQDRLLTK